MDLPYIARAANALHIKTSASVIRRTLLLNQGDPYDSARVVESERALRSLGVFRDVRVDTVARAHSSGVAGANGGWLEHQATVQLLLLRRKRHVGGGHERSKPSWHCHVAFAPLYKTPDRIVGAFVYQNPHFIARRPRLGIIYQPLSDGDHWAWSLGVPFYQTAARRQIGTSGEASTYRVLVFKALKDLSIATTERHVLRFGLNGGSRSEPPVAAMSALGCRLWRREDFTPGHHPPSQVHVRDSRRRDRGCPVAVPCAGAVQHIRASGGRESFAVRPVRCMGGPARMGIRGRARRSWVGVERSGESPPGLEDLWWSTDRPAVYTPAAPVIPPGCAAV